MKKLVMLLAVLALCIPAYGEILVYKTKAKILAYEYDDPEKLKETYTGYMVLDVNLDDTGGLLEIEDKVDIWYWKGSKYYLVDYTFELDLWLLDLGSPWVVLSDFWSYLYIPIPPDEGYFGQIWAVTSGKGRETNIGNGEKRRIAKSTKGHCLCEQDGESFLGSGTVSSRLSTKFTRIGNRANECDGDFEDTVDAITEYLEGKGYEDYYGGMP